VTQPELLADTLRDHIRSLEARLEECEDTLGAIRRGEIDALVVSDSTGQNRIYTLESADRPYRVLIEQIQEGAFTLGGDGTIIYCNRCLADMLNTPHEQLIGRSLQPYVLPDDGPGFRKLMGEAACTGVRRELILRTAEGRAVPAYLSLSRLDDSDTTLLCGVLTDLTAQKIHWQELADANARLSNEIAERERAEDALRQSQKMEAIGQLTGGIAHDFNNMLQAITSGITLAQRRISTGSTERALELLEASLVAADRAATLTQRLLGFGRRQTLDPKQVALDDLIGGLTALVQRTVGPTIAVGVDIQPACWPVWCDPNQLENALLNLAINARDALAPAGGRIDLKADHVTLDETETRLWEDVSPGDFVRITVADNGVGMTPEVLARAFEPFFTTKPPGQGTGLGLSQIYGFIRQSHGLVRLESEPCVGTSVHLYLPRSMATTDDRRGAATLVQRQDAAEAQGSAIVLLVEDGETIRDFTAQALRELGYRVIEAEDGHDGLHALRQAMQAHDKTEVSLLVTDVGLPGGLNGRQLADAARELMPDLPILLITGYAGDALTRQEPPGPDMAMLAKPFALEALAETVQAIIGSAAVA
jgi:PAS domain S-box-containing protein